ncbi:heme exporter protein CcmD [Sphingomonas sp. AR_OL41]|jgi:hypothetical protein|nr:heme exporter protein CcmD [Sphingomonas sp. AR_OL41]MDH7972270.1 heme exporter protein CcmD [Sphingomonas sp. AR_OL41]
MTHLDHWPFIIAAYGLTFAATAGLSVWAWLRMRDAEKK